MPAAYAVLSVEAAFPLERTFADAPLRHLGCFVLPANRLVSKSLAPLAQRNLPQFLIAA
jgi:hypothetical protein